MLYICGIWVYIRSGHCLGARIPLISRDVFFLGLEVLRIAYSECGLEWGHGAGGRHEFPDLEAWFLMT